MPAACCQLPVDEMGFYTRHFDILLPAMCMLSRCGCGCEQGWTQLQSGRPLLLEVSADLAKEEKQQADTAAVAAAKQADRNAGSAEEARLLVALRGLRSVIPPLPPSPPPPFRPVDPSTSLHHAAGFEEPQR